MIDSDLADLYGVDTRILNRAVKRNLARFPKDFLFQLNLQEVANLKYQIGTSSLHGGRRKRPFAFTEQGALMAATVLRSHRAVAMTVHVVRAFVRLRQEMLSNVVMDKRLAQIERSMLVHDVVLRNLYAKIKPLLLAPPGPPKPKIGFHQGNRQAPARSAAWPRRGPPGRGRRPLSVGNG